MVDGQSPALGDIDPGPSLRAATLVRAGSLAAAGLTLRTLLSVATVPLLLVRLGAEKFGVWAFLAAASSLLSVIDLGPMTSTAVFVSRAQAEGGERTRPAIASGRAVAALSAGLAIVLALVLAPLVVRLAPTGVSTDADLRRAFLLMASAQAVRMTAGAWWGTLDGLRAFRTKAATNGVEGLLGSVGLIASAWLSGSLIWMALSQLLAVSSSLLVLMIVAARLLRASVVAPSVGPHRFAGTADQVRFGLGASIQGTLAAVFSQVDRLLVGAMLGAEALGVYAASVGLAMQFHAFSVSFLQPTLSLAIKRAGGNRHDHAVFEPVSVVGTGVTSLAMALATLGASILAALGLSPFGVPGNVLVASIASFAVIGVTAGAHFFLLSEGLSLRIAAISGAGTVLTLGSLYLSSKAGAPLALVAASNSLYGVASLSLFGLIGGGWFRRFWKSLCLASILLAVAVVAGVGGLGGAASWAVCVASLLVVSLCVRWGLLRLTGPSRSGWYRWSAR